MSAPASPIADLSYRNYDGPLAPPLTRWWPIAKACMLLAIKKKGFWAWSSFVGIWYVLEMVIYYFVDINTPPGTKNPLLTNHIWKVDFINAFGMSQLLLFIVTLLIGAGSIANDNRANALLIYLSKPCTKFDYLLGKWLSIAIPLFIISLVPALVYFTYGATSFKSYGFISQDPWLFFKLIPMCAVPAVVHASVAIGVSSMFNQGRMAGATYSAVYFISFLFTVVLGNMLVVNFESAPSFLHNIFYCSIDGLNNGMAKLILGTNGGAMFPGTGQAPNVIQRPDTLFILFALVLTCGLSILIAWRRIRPVEVV